MQNFSTNFQFNIAQMNSLAQEQEKIKSTAKKQQDKVGEKVEQMDNEHQHTVSATEEQNDATKIKEESTASQEEDEMSQDAKNKKDKKKDVEKVILLKDEDRGKIIDFIG